MVGLSSNCEVGVPTRSGYKFNGWFTEEAGGEKVYDASGKCIAGTYWTSSRLYCYDSSLWLYAQWTKVSAMVVVESRAESGGAASEALPEWAVGSTFDGAVAGADGGIVGTVTLTVSEDWAFSGKMLKDGLVRTLSADEVTFAIDESSPFRRVVATGDGWVAWQNLWKTEPWKSAAESFAEAPVLVTPDGVELKFSSSGVVTAKLGAYSCSAVLIPQADGICALYIYFPPEAGVFDGYTAKVEVDWGGTSFLPADFPQE